MVEALRSVVSGSGGLGFKCFGAESLVLKVRVLEVRGSKVHGPRVDGSKVWSLVVQRLMVRRFGCSKVHRSED